MHVDEKITLANGEIYGLLLESFYNNNKYFLAVLLENGEEPSTKYKVLREVKENGELYIKEEKDPVILNYLVEDYANQADDLD